MTITASQEMLGYLMSGEAELARVVEAAA